MISRLLVAPASFPKAGGWGFALFLTAACALGPAPTLPAAKAADADPLAGYARYDEYREQLEAIAKSNAAKLASLGKTAGEREVYLLTLGVGETEKKPALLIVGNVQESHLAGSELAMRLARDFIKKWNDEDEATRKLLDRYTLYIIPRPNPDGTEKNFEKPRREVEGNNTKTDDDRDFQFGEDPFEDLNDDGVITMMRVKDPTGKFMPHPEEPRIMIEADPKKNERGGYRLLTEGIDNDGDEQWNEDAGDGVSFNRNFTFNYGYFTKGAGPNQVSEIETRAIADFCFDHPNIAAVFTFTPEDNLFHTWKPNDHAEGQRIKTTLLKADSPYVEFIAEKYRDIHGGKDAPASPKVEGSFTHWAYFHYGRWSFGARGWWIPTTSWDDAYGERAKEAEKAKEENKEAENGDKTENDAADVEKSDDRTASIPPKPKDERGAGADFNALRYFDKHGIPGFVPWKKFDHPDFPGVEVEIGGFKPFYRLNPPAEALDELAAKHLQFVEELAGLLPSLAIANEKVESLGGGLYRAKATVVNDGYLPTMSHIGQVNGEAYPLQIAIELSAGMRLVEGAPRRKLDRLMGNGGHVETEWLLQTTDKPAGDEEREIILRAWAPAVGEAAHGWTGR